MASVLFSKTVLGFVAIACAQVYSPRVLAQINDAELSVTLSVSNLSPSGGCAATKTDTLFMFRVFNGGPNAATNVELDVGWTPVSSYSSVPTPLYSPQYCRYSAGLRTFICTIGTLSIGEALYVPIAFRAYSASIYHVQGSVSPTDFNPSDNYVSQNGCASDALPGAAITRYRLYSPVTQEHLFTTDLNEYNTLGTYVGTWVQEGASGRVLDAPGTFNGLVATPYYRLYNTSTRWHHWTTDPNEYYTLIQYPNWNGEGIDGFVLPASTTGATQLYRLQYPYVSGLHHWTIDPNEYNTLISSYGWIGEGTPTFVVQ